MTARGEVVQQVATAYLHAIADASEVDNATALEKADEVSLQQAHDAHVAGTLANLDELRARVQLQSQQQTLIAAQNAEEKDLILLKREIGIDPGQKIVLTDPAPYSDLAEQTPAEVRAVAYKNRQDYQNLQNQVIEVRALHSAYRAQRLPSLSFSGILRRRQGEWKSEPRRVCCDGNAECAYFSRSEYSRRFDASAAQLAAVNAQLDDRAQPRSTSRCGRRCWT